MTGFGTIQRGVDSVREAQTCSLTCVLAISVSGSALAVGVTEISVLLTTDAS